MSRFALVAVLSLWGATAQECALDDDVSMLATGVKLHTDEHEQHNPLPGDDESMQATNRATLPSVLHLFEDRITQHGVNEAYAGAVYAGGLSRVNSPKTRVGLTGGLVCKCGFGDSAVQEPRRHYYINFYQCPTLPFGVTDLRGEWEGTAQKNGLLAAVGLTELTNYKVTHRERIEQCEDRVMISTEKSMRDFPHADGTLLYGAVDYDEKTMPACLQYSAAARFDGAGCLSIVSANHAPETRCLFPDGTMRLKQGNTDWIIMHKVKIVEDFKSPGAQKAARLDLRKKAVESPQMPR